MSGQREALIEVLAAHSWAQIDMDTDPGGRSIYTARCLCGARSKQLPIAHADRRRETEIWHRAHLADAILAALHEAKP